MHTGFPRQLSSEILDHLAVDDPRAVHSRRDLQAINWMMGSIRIVAAVLHRHATRPTRMIDLGAGDGSWMLCLARRMAPAWPGVQVTLLDRQDLVSAETRAGFQRVGWPVEVQCIDVNDWVLLPSGERYDIGLANLFVHHFHAGQIAALFAALEKQVGCFIACEPRRDRMALLASRMVGLLGANDVTRTDAVLSVQAGFRAAELTALWPSALPGWQLDETKAGLFSHLFMARRRVA